MTNKSEAASSTQPRTIRQRVYDFMSLPTHRKLERLRDLGLYVDGDCDLPGDKCDLVWLVRAKERGLADALLDGELAASRTVEQPEGWDFGALLSAARDLLEWMPIYSKGSSGYGRTERLKAEVAKFGKGGSLNQAVGVEADLKHPAKSDTGGEIANSTVEQPEPKVPRCSFCHKGVGEAECLVMTPNTFLPSLAYICDACISVCVGLLDAKRKPEPVSADRVEPTLEPSVAEREEFEKWADGEDMPIKRYAGKVFKGLEYANANTDAHWDTWQAAYRSGSSSRKGK
jgi:ClpX C4-type zinc finger